MEQDDGAEFPESPEEAHGLAAEKARRLAKLDALRRAGTDPYPYRFDRTHTLGELRPPTPTWNRAPRPRTGSASPAG